MTDFSVFYLHPLLFGACRHAYSRKYSRFARLRLLGFKTPYFRNLPSKNNTQLFFSVAYRLRLVQ